MNTEANLESLVALYLEGKCSPEEFMALEAQLLDDVGKREYFLEMVLLDQDLGMLSGSREGRIGSAPMPVELMLQRQRRRTVKIALLAAAAVVLVSAVVLWMQMVPQNAPAFASFRVAPESVFVLTHAGEGKDPLGKVMAEDSRIVIEHGAMELALPHQVRAVIEGPATMTLLDERSVQLDRGRAFFEVSSREGRGFTVVTPHQRIVDLGTAFGLDIQPDHEGVELHVIEGRVRVDPPDGREGEVLAATRSVLLTGAQVREDLRGPTATFRRELPKKIETLLYENFESGLVGGRDYDVFTDPTAILDLAGNPFVGISESEPWSFRTARLLMKPAAFHDLGGEPSPGHITTQGNPVDLIQFANGADTGIDFRFSGAVRLDGGKSLDSLPPAEGTPAAALFLASGINLDGGFFASSENKTSGPTEFFFSGMNPGLRYDIALYGDCRGHSSDGKEQFMLIGADDAANRSSTGIVSNFVTEMETQSNADLGHVVRWIGVNPGADGMVSIKIDPAVSGSNNLFCISAVRIAASSMDGVPVNFNGLPIGESNFADGDDLPDRFELAHTNPPSTTELDPDDDLENGGIGDGLTNLQEFLHGTDPYNSDSDGDGVPDGAELAAGTDPTAASVPGELEDPAVGSRDTDPPVIVSRYPADEAFDALLGERLTLTFNKPVKLGTGRVFLRNFTDGTETEIAVGGPRTSVKGGY